jgi:hypothetical protein
MRSKPVVFDDPAVDTHPVDCPKYLLEALQTLQSLWPNYRSGDNPFDNTGAYFKCAMFKVEAFSWIRTDQTWNFRWRDLEVVWYKYLGRDTRLNRQISLSEVAILLEECMLAMAVT